MNPGQDVQLDALDVSLIEMLAAEPRIGVLECSRRLGVARGTVQARLDKLVDRKVIGGFGPEVSPAAIGFTVTSKEKAEESRWAALKKVSSCHGITQIRHLQCLIQGHKLMSGSRDDHPGPGGSTRRALDEAATPCRRSRTT